MTHDLTDLGWSDFQQAQLAPEEATLHPMRVAEIHRARLLAFGPDGTFDLTTNHQPTSAFAVGDWVLVDGRRAVRRLAPRSLIQRRAAGTHVEAQLIAANVDTLLIVSSCNADFNLSRLERYLALALDSGVEPVIVLTKADLNPKAETYLEQARSLRAGLSVLAVDARGDQIADLLAPWCGTGRTIALAGTSGVGKTTLTNALTGLDLATQSIRAADGRGRHTTTFRALHRLARGGYVIDTPGMRELQLTDVAEGINEVFADLTALALTCHFRNCTHVAEPGCAVRAAVEAGTIDAGRLGRFEKLAREDQFNTETIHQRHQRARKFGRMHKRLKRNMQAIDDPD